MPLSAAASAREILTSLHDVMASRTSAQAKLNAVVGIIATAIDSEVCSIYLLREGVLELFATRGLDQAAVHVTKLALGEGLVGTIAEDVEVLNLDEAGESGAAAAMAVLIAATSTVVTLFYMALGKFVERRTQRWRSPAR